MSDKRYYMACLDLAGRSCLVVGGGVVAREKILGLLDCEARVTVVARSISDGVASLPVELYERAYASGDLDGRFLVVAATNDGTLNRRVHSDAEARSLLCNVVDVPALCNFILPAIHRVDPIAIAVSTGGASPALAKRIRDDIATVVGDRHAGLAGELRFLRPWAKERFATYEQRRAFFDDLVERELA
ncbi:MAG: bifunctional precorrin-2 dehydrogenase/sirohydrochlorin ferrochelatase [Gaiellaceae bacterium MAG52_C11]|nr:bifunctional precorrin-2 dehydrogenase/sirohydrochlorin ferrochelatase [Candidatus Gaiellasilicea maunaloa]